MIIKKGTKVMLKATCYLNPGSSILCEEILDEDTEVNTLEDMVYSTTVGYHQVESWIEEAEHD